MASILRTGGIRRLSSRAPQSSSRAYLVVYTCGARSCGSWGRRRGVHDHEEDKRHARKAEAPDAQDGSSRRDPNLKEKIWRQRMDAIRRMIDEDPYEALFGWSNRLRRGQRGFTPPRWLHQELEYLRVLPMVRSEEHPKTDFPKKFERSSETKTAAAKSTVHVDTAETSTSPRSSQDSSPKSSNEPLSEEPILEYDPISNRMVPKGDKTFSHYGQDLDAAVEIPVKPYRPFEPIEESPIPRQAPTFTMLKEEPAESHPSPIENVFKVEPTASDVRSEYDRYKARRLPESTMSRDAWLVNEGFLSKPTEKSTNIEKPDLHKTPALETGRARLEDKFDEAHSPEKEMAQEKLLGEKPEKGQPSKSTSTLELEQKVEELCKKRDSQKSEEVLARKELEQHDQRLFNENLNKNRMRGTKDKKYVDLQEKVNEIRARREILEYNLNVARENLGREQAKATIARMDKFVIGMPILEPLWKAISPKLIEDEDHGEQDSSAKFETSLERHMNNTESKPSTLQTAMDRHNKTTREAIDTSSQELHEQPPRTHDPIGYNHARESKKTHEYETKPVEFEGEKATHRAHLRSRIAEIEARFEESQQRLKGTGRIIIRSNVPSRADQKHTQIFKGSMRHVPSLAEMHGYIKEGATPKAQPSVTDAKAAKRAEAGEALLKKEIEKQKYAMMQAERKNSSSGPEAATTSVSPDQKPVTPSKAPNNKVVPDPELVRTIRSIYESTYGQITTKHRQEGSRAAPDAAVTKVSKPTVQEAQSSPVMEETAAAPTPTPVVPENIPSVTYTILAYDVHTQQVTRATLSSPPADTPETPIPLTIALKGLDAPARFLPHLSALKDSGFTPISAEKNLLILKHVGGLPIPMDEPIEPSPITHQVPLLNLSGAPKQKDTSPDTLSTGVNKLEPVFSGRNFTRTKEEWRRRWWENQTRRRARRRRTKRILKSLALVGGVGVATLYAAGVMAEMKKVTMHDKREG
jgi:hypothetical protein